MSDALVRELRKQIEEAAATITELAAALLPLKRGADEADYYCHGDVPDDHAVLIDATVGELRAARAALAKLEAAAPRAWEAQMRAIERAAHLDEFDKRVLRTCCGENLIDGWGAAVGEALSVLVRAGLATATGQPTALGREVAAALRAEAGGSDDRD